MELECNTLLAQQVEQQSQEVQEETATAIVSLDASGGIDLLSGSQNEMAQAVIIYDTESQEHVVKVITSSESKIDSESNDASIDPDNLITLHASHNIKDEILEEDTRINRQVHIKTEILSQSDEIDEDATLESLVESAVGSVAEAPIESTVEPVAQGAVEPTADTEAEDRAQLLADLEGEPESETGDTSADATEDPETDDDETIATFVTSTGQRLALYAVEDSDEIFAVALYDESGEPPTNFHFLMKADVERLIGEGAVKTVKKPSAQPNKQPKPPEVKEEIKFEKHQIELNVENVEAPMVEKALQIKTEIVEVPMPQKMQTQPTNVQQTELQPTKVQQTTVQQTVGQATNVQQTVGQATNVQQTVVQPTNVQQATVQPTKVQQPMVQPTKVQQATVQPTRVQQAMVQPTKVQQTTVQSTKIQQTAVQPTKIQQTSVQPNKIQQTKVQQTKFQQTKFQPTKVQQTKAQQTKVQQTRIQQITVPPPKTQQIKGQPNRIQQTKAQTTKVQPSKFQPIKAQPSKIQSPIVQPIKFETSRNIAPRTYSINNRNTNITKPQASLTKPTKIVSNMTQVKLDHRNESNIAYVVTNDNESYIIDHSQGDLDSDAEIIEQSTVQYILCDGDVSDSELTFDELQASLESFKTGKSTCSTNTSKTKSPETRKIEVKKEPGIRFSPAVKSTPKVAPILSPRKELSATGPRTYKNAKKARMTNNLLQATKKIKQEIIDPSYGDYTSFDESHISADEASQNLSKDDSAIENLPNAVKVKRSRKQQLTVVNRTDSEIIIQPASVFSEEEEEQVITRKRGRRKKKIVADPDYNPRKPTNKPRKSSHRLVEVIEIDVDESERTNVIDVTLEGAKGKGSSDKENDVISLDDSDEEEDDDDDEAVPSSKTKPTGTKSVMKCNHCTRNFRKRGALERHLHTCPKANLPRKRFKCKLCKDTFDIAVALARHVRVSHSPRKRGRPPKGWVHESDDDEDSENPEIEFSSEESEPDPRPKEPKKRGRPPRKRSISKDESTAGEAVEKSETVAEPSTGPRRRGRPPKKSIPRARSISSSLEEKNESAIEQSSEPRKRGRPRKTSPSKEDKEEKERSMSSEPEEKLEKTEKTEIAQIPKKRGRPPIKRKLSKDESAEVPEPEDKDESATETTSEPKKRGRPSKRSLSKEELSIPNVEEEVAEKPVEKHETSDEISLVLELEDNPEEEKRPIMEPPKKRKQSRDIERLVTPEPEEKSESLTETRKRGRPVKDRSSKDEEITTAEPESSTEIHTEEPRRRGRSAKSDRSITPEPDEKVESSTESRKRGRPTKEKPAETSEPEEKAESTTDVVIEPWKKRRMSKDLAKNDKPASPEPEKSEEAAILPKKRSRSVMEDEEKSETVEVESTVKTDKDPEPSKDDTEDKHEDKPEDSAEPPPTSRKRGRPAKDKTTKDEVSESEEKGDNVVESTTEDNLPAERKPDSTADLASPEPRRRGRPAKDRVSSREDEEPESSTTVESSPEPRKRGRPPKTQLTSSTKDEPQQPESTDPDDKVEPSSSSSTVPLRKRGRLREQIDSEGLPKVDNSKLTVPQRKRFNANQAWKVKKLNCADCGKWFSSAAELATHRLQHRTKKSGHRCRLCKKLITSELYERHLATHHSKSTATRRQGHKRTLRSLN